VIPRWLCGMAALLLFAGCPGEISDDDSSPGDDDDTTAGDDDTTTDDDDDDTTGDDDDDDDVTGDPQVTTFAGSPGGPGLSDGFGDAARFFHPYGVTWHDGLVFIGGGWDHAIRVFDPDTAEVTTLVGRPGEAGYVDTGGGDPMFNFPCGLEVGPDGLLYVADRDNGRIRVVEPATGIVATVEDHNGPVLADELFDVAFGEGTTLYFSDILGCSIRWVDTDTGDSGILAGVNGQCWVEDGPPATGRIGRPRDLVYHPDGFIYYADRNGDNIRRIDVATGDLETVFGAPDGDEPGYVDDVGLASRFSEPSGLELIGDVLYATDSDNDGVRAMDLVTGAVTTLAGFGVNGNADGPADQSSFSWPIGLTSDAAGDLYVMDPGGHCLRHVDMDAGTVSTPAGTVGNTGSIDGVGIDARLTEPRALVRGDGSTVWIADSSNLQVRTLDIDTAEVATVAGAPLEYDHVDGVGEDARFMTVTGAAWVDGRLFVTEIPSNTIRTVDAATTEVVTVAGQAMAAGDADGVGTQALFNNPRGIVLAEDGLLYVLDSGNAGVRRLDPDTLEVTTLLSRFTPGNPLGNPEGMAADGAGNLFLSDYSRCTLVAVPLQSGDAVVVAGTPNQCDSVDAIGTQARFDRPKGLDADPATGLVYVADYDGHTIRVFDPLTNHVTTLTGDPDTMDPADGPLAEATFPTPTDILVVDDHLLVLDLHGAHVRKVELP